MYERSFKLPDGKKITFSTEETNETGIQIIETFNKSIPFLSKDTHKINTSDYWRMSIESNTGNRNSTFILNTVYDNIMTPVEVSILSTRGYPTDMKDVIKYMCDGVVSGRIDDWNSIENLRLRSSEIFVSMLQKQIHSAYNEYVAKMLSGDSEAKLFINPTNVSSVINTSQNVQMFENINPIEELSMMTRITPLGIGGITKASEWPKDAMNIHYSYYGNIDPLECPDSENMGITQHLALGANISSTRGLFISKDRDKIKDLDILSVGPSLIPFVESNDGLRIVMATGQAKQAVPLKNPEIPAIQTGFESVYTSLLSSSFMKKAPVDGEITEISDLHINIKGVDGKIYPISTEPVTLKSGQGKNGLSVFKSKVLVGQKVKKGQALAEGANVNSGILSNGLNMLVAFMPWKGYNFEDGMVISESAASKFISVHVETQRAYLEPEEDISYIAGLNQYVKKGDVILTYSSALYDVESLNHLRADGGKIVNIEIYSNIPEEEIPEAIRPIYEDFKNRYILLNGKYPIGSFKEKNKPFKGILIVFTLEQALTLAKGDKLNNRHFNKGVIAIIEKDENMPVLPNGDRVDMIYSTLSVINRMNPGQLLEMHTGLISRHLSRLMEKNTREDFIGILENVIKFLDGSNDMKYSKNLIGTLKSMSNNAYETTKEQVIKNKFFPLIFTPFRSPSRDSILTAMKILGLKTKYPLYLPEYGKKSEPIAIGFLYVLKLEHMSEKKINSRSTGPYSAAMFLPSGSGKGTKPQKAGEYDLYSLLAWDCPTVIDEIFGPLSADHKVKNELISEIVQTGKAAFKVSLANPVRDAFKQFMTSIHLESE